MKTKIKTDSGRLRRDIIRLCHVHFALVAAFVVQIIVYDSSKLITPHVVLQRWLVTSGLLAVTGTVWYLAHAKGHKITLQKWLVLALIAADMAVAAFNVYTQRGMASRAVLLFIIPILVSAVLYSRAALFATAVLAVAVYSTTCVKYFVDFFNEGYKVELYGEVAFYSATFLVIATLFS